MKAHMRGSFGPLLACVLVAGLHGLPDSGALTAGSQRRHLPNCSGPGRRRFDFSGIRYRRNRLKRQPDTGIDDLGAVMHVPLFIDFEVLAMWQISKTNSDLMAEKNLLDIG